MILSFVFFSWTPLLIEPQPKLGISPAKTQRPQRTLDCHFERREKSFLDPSHFVRDDTPRVSLGDFAPWREEFSNDILPSYASIWPAICWI
jgi:hypothetical protein